MQANSKLTSQNLKLKPCDEWDAALSRSLRHADWSTSELTFQVTSYLLDCDYGSHGDHHHVGLRQKPAATLGVCGGGLISDIARTRDHQLCGDVWGERSREGSPRADPQALSFVGILLSSLMALGYLYVTFIYDGA